MKLCKSISVIVALSTSLLLGNTALAEPLLALAIDPPLETAPKSEGSLLASFSLVMAGFAGFTFACRGMTNRARAKF